MFSVDNFYTIFQSHYGYPRTNNMVYLFQPHGSKKWHDLVPGLPSNLIKNMSLANRTLFGKIVMHDQEPLFIDSLNTYRDSLLQNKKTEYYELYNYLDPIDLVHLDLRSGKIPIICTSELHSKDVEIFRKKLFIDCYYWWHGMIARDWFRHWQYHFDLTNKDIKNYSYRFLLYARETTGTRKYRKQIIDQLGVFSDKIQFDWNGSKETNSGMSASICVEDSISSAIHLVAETLFDVDKIYLTEKIFKPMVMGQPFILAGPPNSLGYLRDYGFRTFSTVWDESYDQIEDHNARLASVIGLVEKLLSLSKENFDRILEKCIPIIEHNRSWFYSQEFQDRLRIELQQNVARATEIQKAQEKEYPGGAYTHLYNEMLKNKFSIPPIRQEVMKDFLQISNETQLILKKYPGLSILLE